MDTIKNISNTSKQRGRRLTRLFSCLLLSLGKVTVSSCEIPSEVDQNELYLPPMLDT